MHRFNQSPEECYRSLLVSTAEALTRPCGGPHVIGENCPLCKDSGYVIPDRHMLLCVTLANVVAELYSDLFDTHDPDRREYGDRLLYLFHRDIVEEKRKFLEEHPDAKGILARNIARGLERANDPNLPFDPTIHADPFPSPPPPTDGEEDTGALSEEELRELGISDD